KSPADLDLTLLRIVMVIARAADHAPALALDDGESSLRFQRRGEESLEHFALVAIGFRVHFPDQRIVRRSVERFKVIGRDWPQLEQLSLQVWLEIEVGHRDQNRRFSRRMPISLSPRPLIFTITTSPFFIFGARLMISATACDDSSAGMMPSDRARVLHASS